MSFEVRSNFVGSNKVGSTEVESKEVESIEVGSIEVGSIEVGSKEVGSKEVGSKEVGSKKVGVSRGVLSAFFEKSQSPKVKTLTKVEGLGQNDSKGSSFGHDPKSCGFLVF